MTEYKRHSDDFYPTPSWVTAIALEWLVEAIPSISCDPVSMRAFVYDPHCGTGNILQVVHDVWPAAIPMGTDISDDRVAVTRASGIIDVWRASSSIILDDHVLDDATTKAYQTADLIIMNPPFKFAIEAIATARSLAPDTPLLALLPLGALGSKKRIARWKDIGYPDGIRIVSPRPKFISRGTLSTDVAWMLWGGRYDLGCEPIGSLSRPDSTDMRA